MVSIDWLDWSSMSVSLKSSWRALATSQRLLWGSPISTRLCQLRLPAWLFVPHFKTNDKNLDWTRTGKYSSYSDQSGNRWDVERVVNDVNSYRQGVRVRRGWTISAPGWRTAKAWAEDSARTAWLAGLANGPAERDGNKDGSAAPGATSDLWKGPRDLRTIFCCSCAEFLPAESPAWSFC